MREIMSSWLTASRGCSTCAILPAVAGSMSASWNTSAACRTPPAAPASPDPHGHCHQRQGRNIPGAPSVRVTIALNCRPLLAVRPGQHQSRRYDNDRQTIGVTRRDHLMDLQMVSGDVPPT